MTKQTIKSKFLDIGYSDKRAEELAEMFIFFTEGYNVETELLNLNL